MKKLIICLLLIGCSTPQVFMDPKKNYQRDLIFEIESWDASKNQWAEKQKFIGTALVKQSLKYRVRVYSHGKVDMLTLNSCHREMKTPKPDKKGGWFKKKYYEFEFSLDDILEANRDCVITLGAYEKHKGRHGWATIAIDWNGALLKADLRCNGQQIKAGGSSFCQAKKGLIQMISFQRRMDVTFYGKCVMKAPVDRQHWEYEMPPGLCILHFFDELNTSFEHVHYLYGYDTIPIRGVN